MLGFLVKMFIAGVITLAIFSGVAKLVILTMRPVPITVILEEPCPVDNCSE